jgi:hypothetical protein
MQATAPPLTPRTRATHDVLCAHRCNAVHSVLSRQTLPGAEIYSLQPQRFRFRARAPHPCPTAA